jgi:15-hydroxyprostaglandin dehydrogenase (NAD)
MSKQGAIVTGAASGVGLELTKHLLSKGWKVVTVDINQAGEAISKDLGADVLWVETDISSWDAQVQLFETGNFPPLIIETRLTGIQLFKWCPEISFISCS